MEQTLTGEITTLLCRYAKNGSRYAELKISTDAGHKTVKAFDQIGETILKHAREGRVITLTAKKTEHDVFGESYIAKALSGDLATKAQEVKKQDAPKHTTNGALLDELRKYQNHERLCLIVERRPDSVGKLSLITFRAAIKSSCHVTGKIQIAGEVFDRWTYFDGEAGGLVIH